MRAIDADNLVGADGLFSKRGCRANCNNCDLWSPEGCRIILEAPTVDVVSRELFEQYKWERDIAIKQLEELGLSLGQKIECANVVLKEQYEELREAFVDCVCSGVNNLAPYCKNRCDECVDSYGYCTYRRCTGFNPDGRKYE